MLEEWLGRVGSVPSTAAGRPGPSLRTGRPWILIGGPGASRGDRATRRRQAPRWLV